MALHPNFSESPYAILDPALRWFPADESLRESSSEKLMPPLVPQLRRKVKEWRGRRLGGGPASVVGEAWRRYVGKTTAGTGKTKALSRVWAWSFAQTLCEPESQLAR